MEYDLAASQVISGYEKDGDIFVEVVLGESGYINKNDVGFTPEILERWHREGSWQGLAQNVHPSKNHPLVYEPRAPENAPIQEKLHHYITRSNKYGFGNFVKTKLVDLKDGINKRLSGIFRIVDEGAKRAWKEGKFPRYNSSSVLIVSRNEKGLINDGYPIASTCVDTPAYPVDVAKIQNQCEGGEECVTKLAESGCFCKHEVLTNFENRYSSQYNQEVSENSMTDSEKPANSSGTEGESQESLQQTQTQTSADGKTTKEVTTKEEEEVDWKSKFLELEKEAKKKDKTHEEYVTDTSKKLERIFKEKLETNIRGKLEKIPVFAFDNKEENREKEVERFMKLYPKLAEDEILEQVDHTYKLAPKIMEVSKKSHKVGESGITNDGKLIAESGAPTADIRKAHEVFG